MLYTNDNSPCKGRRQRQIQPDPGKGTIVSTQSTHPTRTRNGTETRQRTKMVGLRLRPEEHRRLTRLAELRGVNVAALFESTVADLLATPLPDEALTA